MDGRRGDREQEKGKDEEGTMSVGSDEGEIESMRGERE